MAKVHQTPEAEAAVTECATHIARDRPLQTLRWLDEIEATFNLLATQPATGQQVQTKRFGPARRHVVGNYLIYYQPAEDGIRVVLVIHAARDHDRLV
jgi:plasmid stabilization system protein ParE